MIDNKIEGRVYMQLYSAFAVSFLFFSYFMLSLQVMSATIALGTLPIA